MWRTIAALLLLWQGIANACLNDRDSDTLAAEAQGLPDVVQVITGRFPRNPPLFYEMRTQRVAAELGADPTKLGLYDDIAVACDRLGQDDAAISWIEKKRQQLQQQGQTPQSDRESWYRYYANLGTFEAHRWLRAGADRNKIDQMQQARDDIAQAIHLKPNAHFGREKYQLRAMDWILEEAPLQYPESGLPSFIRHYHRELRSSPVEGLCGLIVLGNAWESVDIFNALKEQLRDYHGGQHDTRSLSYLALLRCQELADAGKRSLMPGTPRGKALRDLVAKPMDPGDFPYSPSVVTRTYWALRKEAESWQQQRTTYMLVRLKAGRHPDKDPTFWKEYTDPGPPNPDSFIPWYYRPKIVRDIVSSFALRIATPIILLLLSPFILRALVNRSRRRKAALKP